MELEFRAWTYHDGWSDGIMVTQTLENEENGYLCMNVQKVVYLSDKYKEQNGEIVEVSQWEECNDTIIMQYTGLKDKNKKKIFNGDIVNSSNGKGVVTYVEGDGWFIKTSEDIKKWYDTFEEAQCRLPWNEVEKLEILGNIYEHPHLIEEHGN